MRRVEDLKLTQKAPEHARVNTTSDSYVHLEEDPLKVATVLLAGEILGNYAPIVTQSSQMVSSVTGKLLIKKMVQARRLSLDKNYLFADSIKQCYSIKDLSGLVVYLYVQVVNK